MQELSRKPVPLAATPKELRTSKLYISGTGTPSLAPNQALKYPESSFSSTIEPTTIPTPKSAPIQEMCRSPPFHDSITVSTPVATDHYAQSSQSVHTPLLSQHIHHIQVVPKQTRCRSLFSRILLSQVSQSAMVLNYRLSS